MSDQGPTKTGASIRLALELGPGLLFFAVARWQGPLVGTAAFMAAAVLAAAVSWYRERRLPIVPTFGASLALILGGGTLVLRDPGFIAMQPTVVNLATATGLAAMLLRGRLVLKSVFGVVVPARDAAWRRLTWCAVAYLVALGALNEVVRQVWTIDTWIAFKAFGLPVLDGTMAALAWAYLRARPDDRARAGDGAAGRLRRGGIGPGR